MNAQEIHMEPQSAEPLIDWRRLAEPQSDEYDSQVILAFARQRGYVRQSYPKNPTWFDSKVALLQTANPSGFPSSCLPASYAHPNLPKAWNLLSLWTAAFRQFQCLIESVAIFINTEWSPDRVTGSVCASVNRFGKIAASINGYAGFAESLVREMAHQKLWALGIELETAQRLIANLPEQSYPSPTDYDCLRPMSAVLHAQYSYAHVAALDIAILQNRTSPEQDRQVADYLACVLPKLEFGYKIIRNNAEVDEAGAEFLAGLFVWLDRILEEGYTLLEQLQIAPKPFTHPLVKSVNLTRPCRCNNVEEHSLGDELLIYSSEQEMAFSLNCSSKAIWELCDGNHTLEEIAAMLGRRFGCSGDVLLKDIDAAVSQFRQLGLLQSG